MLVEGPGDDDGIVGLPASFRRDVPASFFYPVVAPDLETLAEQSGARDYQPCGHTYASRKPDGSCGACRYEAWLAAHR